MGCLSIYNCVLYGTFFFMKLGFSGALHPSSISVVNIFSLHNIEKQKQTKKVVNFIKKIRGF